MRVVVYKRKRAGCKRVWVCKSVSGPLLGFAPYKQQSRALRSRKLTLVQNDRGAAALFVVRATTVPYPFRHTV